MPSRAWPFWLLTGLLLLAFPALNFIYWPAVLQSGALPPEGDSIGIPMYGSILLAVLAAPVVIGTAWICLRRYNPNARLAAWRRDRPYRSATATLIFLALAVLTTTGAFADLNPSDSWAEYLWAAYALLWLPWLLGLRAAVIEQLTGHP